MLYRHCFSNFDSEVRVQVKQDGLKLNGKYLLVYADDVNVFCGRVHTLENNKDALVVARKEIEVARKEIGLEVNADKTKYMVMS